MSSFLPIKWPASDRWIALLISALALGLAMSELDQERVIDVREIAYLVVVLVSVSFIWFLIVKGQNGVEATLRERTSALSGLACYLQSSLESERLALSQELHDELGALLTMAKLDVARIGARLSPVSPDVEDCLTDLVRTLNCGLALKTKMVEGLRPSTLGSLGLKITLENYLADFSKRTHIEVDSSLDIPVVNGHLNLIAFRIVQESLTNILRHAHARKVVISLHGGSDDLRIVIKDNGIGFESIDSDSAVRGIAGMGHRAKSVGGRFEIESSPGLGTTVRAFLPISTRVMERRHPSPRELHLSSQRLSTSSIF